MTAIGTRPPALEPLMRWRRILSSLAGNQAKAVRSQAIAMRDMLERTGGLLPEHRIIGHFDLAKLWTRMREPDLAFPHWMAATGCSPRSSRSRARIIACERDPRDVGLSIFTFRFYGMHGYRYGFADLGSSASNSACWRAVLPNPVLTVRLRDWVEGFGATLCIVLESPGLEYDPACENSHVVERRVRTVSRSQVRHPVNAKGIGCWQAHERHLQPLIEALDEAGAC